MLFGRFCCYMVFGMPAGDLENDIY
ncbi:MAG: hypothetical protein ACD_69C00165G0004, partial [uncultured bacterium]